MARWVVVALACLAAGGPAAAQQRRAIDSGVEPTSWGKASGYVYDAVTLLPIPGADVSVRVDAKFADQGRSTAKTVASGQYEARVPIGRVSENFDIGRALSSGIAGLLLGGATNRTKRIDVVQLPLRIRMDGYHEFRGLVPCRRLEPGAFAVRLEPILLGPESGGTPSFVALGWGRVRLDSVTVEPDVVRPGESIILRATLRAPRMAASRDITVTSKCALWGTRALRYVSGAEDGAPVYATTLRAPGARKRVAEAVLFGIGASRLDVDAANALRLAHVQLVTDPQDLDVARTRAAAWAAEASGDYVEATARWRTVCGTTGSDHRDFAALAASARHIHADAEAAAALERAVQRAPEKERMGLMGQQAAALRFAGAPADVITRFGPLLQPDDGKQRRQELPQPLLVALGESYVATGDLARAGEIDARLIASQTPPDDSARRFRANLRVAQARAAMAADPKDTAARTRYARLLLDEGRWEEAEELLRASMTEAPVSSDGARDLAYAALQRLGPAADAVAQADEEALRVARQRVTVSEGGKPTKSKDFRAWHDLAMLLLARLPADTGSAPYRRLVEECRETLREALRCARSGANVNEGAYGGPLGYLSARTVGIAGYSYDEAAADYVIYESLGVLVDEPADGLAALALAGALCDMARADIARTYAERASSALPADAEARYVMALVELGTGRRADASRLLREVVALNPRHPNANLRLAELSAEEGDTALAARFLWDHASFYGGAIEPPNTGEARP